MGRLPQRRRRSGGGVEEDAAIGLASRLRDRTDALHRLAERSGFVASMLRGRASRYGYALFLRNLLPAYRALESGLEGGRDDPRLAPLALPALYRCAAIERDLATLLGAEATWPAMLSSGTAYGQQVTRATGIRLIAHAYVRYMGDLSGGQILSRILARTPGFAGTALAFHDYPTIGDCKQYRDMYWSIIDQTALAPADEESVVEEACAAFEHNIELSQQLAAILAHA